MRHFGKCAWLLWMVLQYVEEIDSITEAHEVEVDDFISEYVKEVRRTLRIGLEKHVINKRSYPDIDLNKLTGMELLVGFQELHSLPSRFPQDIILFSYCLPEENLLFSAAIETKPQGSLRDNELVLYKYQEDEWMETHRVKAAGGQNVAVELIQDSVYLVVAQHLAEEDLGSTVWRLEHSTETLQFVHMLNTRLASQAIMWTDTYTYAAIAISENPSGSQRPYSTLSPVYRWLGNSFDMIDALPTYNPRAMVQFNIRSSVFVAVANFQNDYGETVIDSEIFRYDLTSDKFNVYQKLPTEAAIDIKSFCYQSNQITESFLIYASLFHTDEKGIRDYNSPSVVYKLSDEEFFVPFQALQVSKVTSWLPVEYTKVKDGLESLTLIGASEEGIISFQYDGWRFVPTGLHIDTSTFGPGPKALNVFYYKDKAFVSVANKHSSGYEINVFNPVFKPHPGVENLQKTISDWVETMTHDMVDGEVKMIELARIAREAPSVGDSVIKLGSHAVFKNVEIHRLETIATKVGNSSADDQVYSQLYNLKSQLDNLKVILSGLPNRIDQTSYHTNTVYEDTLEDSADITCTYSCHVHDLELVDVNNENLSQFWANTVNIKEDVEFLDDVSFKELAVIEPFKTNKINGHLVTTLIDWTKEIVIDHKLKVEGDVLAEDSVQVSEAVDGVLLNVFREENFEPEVIVSSTTDLETLNTSQLLLADGDISKVDFRNFVLSTLKTHGDQSFSVFQDIGRIEAEEVTAPDLYKAVSSLPSMSQRSSCVDENCSEDKVNSYQKPDPGLGLSQPTSRARSKNLESINLLDDVIILPRNITLYGTVIVEDGSLTTSDLIDLKHDVSAGTLSQYAIPLDQSIINQHFKFEKEPNTSILHVDMINSVPLESLVNIEEEDSVKLTGKKVFLGSLAVDGTLRSTKTVDKPESLKHAKADKEDLDQVDLEHLDVNEIQSSNIMVGTNNWQNRIVLREDGSVIFDSLNVDENLTANNVMLRGKINHHHLENLLNDSVFEGDDDLLITGTKHFAGESEVQHLDISSINNSNIQMITPESVWRKRLLEAEYIEVDQLIYTGKLDGLESSVFGRWLLTDGDQSVAASQAIEELYAENVAMPPGATINSHNITHLLTEAVSLSGNANFDRVVFDESVSAYEVQVGGRVSSLEVPADIVVTDPAVEQLITGHKRVLGSVSLTGDLLTFCPVSDVNITAYCHALVSDQTKLVISGNGRFDHEPEVSTSVNNIDWPDIMRGAWFKDDVTIIEKVLMNEIEIENLAVDYINNKHVEDQLSKLVSLSKDQDIQGSFYFSNVRAERGLKGDEATVAGNVQGIQLPTFTKNVLLNGVNQAIAGYLDFNKLVIKHDFNTSGFLNGLNISSDLMLVNVESNVMTAELTLDHLITKQLRLPAEALVAGVNISEWSSSAVTKSGVGHVVSGNITVMGQLDSGRGIRVERMVNDAPFDLKHVMLLDEAQDVAGKKSFSPKSQLMIHNLTVEGYFNHVNLTSFYEEQVTANGDVRFPGPKQFTAALWSERVVLPQIYQDHNLTWLEYQLSTPIPWPSYDGQLARISQSKQLASQCLAARAYYLRNMTRAGEVDGDILFTLPLRSGNTTVLGVVRRDTTATMEPSHSLSLLQWSDKQNMFIWIPGVKYPLRVLPSQVQTVTLPGGDLAAYVASYLPHNETYSEGHGDLLRLKEGKIIQMTILGGHPGSQLLSLLDYKQRTCFVVVSSRCKVVCYREDRPPVRLPNFHCKNISKAATFRTDRGQYVVGVQTRPQGSLILWRMSGPRFTLIQELPQFNPTSIAATTTTSPHIAVANMHHQGHSRVETVDIFRLDENTSQLHLSQSLPTVSPHLVVFSSLPSSESVLYVSSRVPAYPIQVYIYRGLLGYQHLTSDATLPVPYDLQPLTDHQQRHFLVLQSNHSASVLRAEFEGSG